jgi:hypothetical protein
MDPIKDLPPITAYPNHQNRRVLLTFMLAAMDDTGFVELSRRLVQEDLVRVGGGGVSRNLKRLCGDGWLYSDLPGHMGVGTIYEPGWRLRGDRELGGAWRAWANVLFGDGGIATPWKGTDALAYQSLGAHGLLVLAAIEQENGLISRKALRKRLKPILETGSVDSRLDWLEIHDLLNVTNVEALEVHSEWRERLDALFGENDVVAPRVKSTVHRERSALYEKNGLSPELMRLKRNVRGKLCWKCRKPAVDLDHNPPQAWGGLDCEVMTRPSCKKCNGSVSSLIRGTKPLPTKKTRIFIPAGQDVNEAAWAMYRARHDLIDQYFARKMVDRARFSASMALSIYGAISGLGSGVYQQQTRVSDRGGSRLRHVRVEIDPDGKKYMRTKTSPRKRVGLGR